MTTFMLQELQSKLDAANNWIAEITMRIDQLSEIPLDRTEASMERLETG